MASFAETRFEAGYIIFGTQGGAQFSTDVVTVGSGFESRNQNWQYGKGKWDFGDRKLPDTELTAIINFFRARKGMAQGFRFKDWGDYKDDGQGTFGTTGLGNSTAGPFQMTKKYVSGADSDLRLIQKPVASTIKVYKNGVLHSTSLWTLNSTTGMITFSAPYPTGADTISWTGEFDVPVRFNVDDLTYRFDSAATSSPGVVSTAYFYVSALPLVEIRV